jgi:hypothetical protein
LLGYQNVQVVSGTASEYGQCPNVPPSNACSITTGVATLGPSGDIVVASTQPTATFETGNGNYTVILDPQTGQLGATLSFPCQPYDPYYPGTGSVYYVDCSIGFPVNGGESPGVYAVSTQTNALVARIVVPGFGGYGGGNDVLAWDPDNGWVYACDGGSLLALSFLNSSVVFDSPAPMGCGGVVYDLASNSLLVMGVGSQTSGGTYGLQVADPRTGLIESVILSTENVTSLVIDSANGWVAAGTLQGDVLLLNDSTWAEVSTISVGNAGAPQGGPTQLVLDHTHSDLYLLTAYDLAVVNESTGSVLTTVSIGAPAGWTSAYSAAADTMFIDPRAGYLEAVAFSHTTSDRLTGLLWLTPSSAVLVLGAAAGVLVAVVARSQRRRRQPAPR